MAPSGKREEANVVIGEQAREGAGSGRQVLLEVEDRGVIDVLTHLAEEPDSERVPRLHEGRQLGHDQPMGLARDLPGSTGPARTDAAIDRPANPRNRGKVIERASRVCELAPQSRLARRETHH